MNPTYENPLNESPSNYSFLFHSILSGSWSGKSDSFAAGDGTIEAN
jgi:hypothetical protein